MADLPKGQHKKQISAEEFIKVWRGDYLETPAYDSFYETIMNSKKVVFKDYIVLGDILLDNETIQHGIELNRCIARNFKIKDSTLCSINLLNSIVGYFDISNSALDFITIEDNSTTGFIRLREKSSTGPFKILSRSTIDSIIISDSSTGSFLVLSNSKVGNFTTEHNSKVGTISSIAKSQIGDCKILSKSTTGSFKIDSGSKAGSVEVTNSTIGTFSVNDGASAGNISIKNAISGDFNVFGNSKAGHFTVTSSTIGSLQIAYSTIGHIIAYKSKIKFIQAHEARINNLELRDNSESDALSLVNSQASDITLNHSTIHEQVLIHNQDKQVRTIGYFNILYGSQIERLWLHQVEMPHLSIFESTIKKIRLDSGVTIGEFSLEQLLPDSRTLEMYSVRILKFIIRLDSPYRITVDGTATKRSVIFELTLNNIILPREASLHISNTSVNNLNINSFINYGTIIFNSLRPINITQQLLTEFDDIKANYSGGYFSSAKRVNSKINIINSDLGNVQFIGCDIAGFKRFEFLNSKMASVFLADTKLPHKRAITTPFELRNNENEQRRLALSQFKKIYENQGDVVRATQYRAEEMEVYREQLRGNESIFLSKNWIDNRSERLNLSLNKFSNYYGNNWAKAVWWTILFNSILFTFYCFAQGYSLGNDWEKFGILAAYSFEFLNPLRKADFLEHVTGKQPGADAIAIDYISRIIMAYFVYQTISAFRKFGKSTA